MDILKKRNIEPSFPTENKSFLLNSLKIPTFKS